MSSDNGIFIFDHPHGYGLAHETLSAMPHCIDRLIKTNVSSLNDPVLCYATKEYALGAARKWHRHLTICEYGIVDMANDSRVFRPGSLARHDAKLPNEVMQTLYY